jgi:16S rRNA (uracil1498-N3)-methyltransferase
MDIGLQNATELGLGSFIPLVTERAVVKLSASQVASRRVRWERIVLGAAKQCGTPWLPRLATPCGLDDFLAGPDRPDVLLFGELEADAQPLREALAPLKAKPPRQLGVVVGPEGDLSAEEKRRLREAGALPVSLGSSVLRSETAALYALSIIRYEFGA